MRRHILSGSFIFFLACAALSAQTCKVDVIDLTAKISVDPSSVHVLLGDAMLLNPDCLGELFEAAVVAAKPDDDTLTQLIKMAVSQYPEESVKIAEAAVMASSDQVDVIRAAFSVPRKVIVATPVEIPKDVTPIEKFLLAFRTTRPFNPEDLADNVLFAIDQLLVKMNRKEERGLTYSGEIVEILSPKPVEEIKLSLADTSVNITTLGKVHRDRTEELLPVLEEPLIIRDPVEESPERSLSRTIEKASRKAVLTPSLAKPREIITSSVYHIPSSNKDEGAAKKSGIANPVFRAQPVSPTMPR